MDFLAELSMSTSTNVPFGSAPYLVTARQVMIVAMEWNRNEYEVEDNRQGPLSAVVSPTFG